MHRSPSDVLPPMYAVRRRPYFLLSGAFLWNCMPNLDDIWYVARARAKGAHAEFWAGHMLIKYLICIIHFKNLNIFVRSLSRQLYALP